jgi:hypothetical protein
LLTAVLFEHTLEPDEHTVVWFQHSSPAGPGQLTPAVHGLQVPLLHTPVLQVEPLTPGFAVQVPVELEHVRHSPHEVEQQVPPTQLPFLH